MAGLGEYLDLLGGLSETDKRAAIGQAVEATKAMRWVPNPGPQTAAWFCEADELFYGGQAGGGKALALDTPLPTPAGWTTMRDIQPGDQVIDEAGKPCSVTAVSPVMIGRPCYRVRFSDGAEIVADADHLWLTLTEEDRERELRQSPAWRARRRAARPSRGTGKRPDLGARNSAAASARSIAPVCGTVRTTREIAESVLSSRRALNHSVSVCEAVQTPDAALPIDPYLLGAWLGDGTAAGARICMAENEMVQQVAAACAAHGWGVTKGASLYDYGIVGGLKVALGAAGLLKNKRIPAAYLRGSIEQRIALLQGLMDTDGYVDARGQCEFTNTNAQLAMDAAEIIRSLGCKATIGVGMATLNGRDIGPKYRIKFMAPFAAFRLPRKLEKQKRDGFRQTVTRRYVESVEPVPSVPVKCIAVDSPSRLYLAGRDFVPTHNSDLGIGLALEQHQKSLLLRKFNDDARGLGERLLEITGTRNGWNGQLLQFREADRLIEFDGCQHESDKQRFKGKPHDLIVFDEVSDFSKTQYIFICGWNRSATPGQRSRVVATGNPPTTPEGMWVLEHWAAWLDPTHPNPAAPGELRWYTTGEDGQEIEVDGPGPHVIGGEEVIAKSRTFIPAKLSDNPDLAATNYDATLAALPAELRAAYREGKFEAGLKDQPFQVIPTDWIRAAQERWTERPPIDVPMCAIGVDCSGGGRDPMILSIRHDGWFAEAIVIPGKDIPKERAGQFAAGMVVSYRRNNAMVIVDMGGGYGGPIYEQLHTNGIQAVAHKGAEGSVRRTKDGLLGFTNKRSEVIWRFREALDPGQPGGSPIALPPSQTLLADLAAPTFRPVKDKIEVEEKKKVCERLGRSTDEGDAVVMAWSAGPTYITDGDDWMRQAEANRPLGRTPQVVMGRANRR